MSLYTLQFVRQKDRPEFIRQVYTGLQPGGAFILVEKVLGADARVDGIFVELYHAFKRQREFSADEVVEKALSLRGILVPDTVAENEARLHGAGFRTVDTFFRWCNWVGWLAIK